MKRAGNGEKDTHTAKVGLKRKAIHMSTAQGAAETFRARGCPGAPRGSALQGPLSCCAQEARGQSQGSRTLRARTSVWAGQEGSPKSRDDCGMSSAGSAGPPTKQCRAHPAGQPPPAVPSPPCRATPPAAPSPPCQSPPGLPARSLATAQAGWCRSSNACRAPAAVYFSSCTAEMGPPRHPRQWPGSLGHRCAPKEPQADGLPKTCAHVARPPTDRT